MTVSFGQKGKNMKTIEEQIKEMNTKELAKFLFDFFAAYNNESIEGLCDQHPCYECGKQDPCTVCIEEWLKMTKLNMNK